MKLTIIKESGKEVTIEKVAVIRCEADCMTLRTRVTGDPFTLSDRTKDQWMIVDENSARNLPPHPGFG